MGAALRIEPTPAPAGGLTLTAEDLALIRGCVRRSFGQRIRRLGANLDDVVQDVVVHILAAQSRPLSRYSPDRGTWEAYLYAAARSGARNALRRPRRWQAEVPTAWTIEGSLTSHAAPKRSHEDAPVVPFDPVDRTASDFSSGTLRLTDALALLDTEEEREVVRMMADGLRPFEMRARLGLSIHAFDELRERVRIVLGILR